MRIRVCILASLLLFLSCSVPVYAVIRYKIHDLGWPLGGQFSEAFGINDRGQIVGRASIPDESDQAVLWEPDGRTTLLGSPFGWGGSCAVAVSNMGRVVGFALNASLERHAVVWAEWVGLGRFGAPGVSSPVSGIIDLGPGLAFDINDRGQVVGALGPVSYEHAFLLGENGMVDLGVLGGSRSVARGINEAGEVVGRSDLYSDTTPPGAPSAYHAFRWTSASGMVDLGTLPGHLFSQANAINDAGRIVGSSFNTPVMWEKDGSIDTLPIPPAYRFGTALDINNQGQIIGTLGAARIDNVIWDIDGSITVLPPLPGGENTGRLVRAINYSGHVVGYSYDAIFRRHAVLWRPDLSVVFDPLPGKPAGSFNRTIPIRFRIVDTDGFTMNAKRNAVSLEVSTQGADGLILHTFYTADGTLRFEPGAARYGANIPTRDCPSSETSLTLTVRDAGWPIGESLLPIARERPWSVD